MKTRFARGSTSGRALATLILAFASASIQCLAGETGKPDDAPAGSLLMHGPKRTNNATPPNLAFATNSPEHLFGLQIEEALKTNNLGFIWRAFDIDAFYGRFVPGLPVSDDLKQKIYAAPHRSAEVRQSMATELLVDVQALPHTRFLGTRLLGRDCALLFRDADGTGTAFERVTPMYIAFIAGRQPDGTVRIVDAHRFRAGELISQSVRRRLLMDLARKSLLSADRLTPADQQMTSSSEPQSLFDSRYDYGKFSLIKDAYDHLPPEVQNDRQMLLRYASRGDRGIKDVMVPVQRWRKLYPNDPTPDLILVDFYWLLYYGPRWVPEGADHGMYHGESWAPDPPEAMESGLEAAIERANAWFADPRMEVRMAVYYGPKRAEKARPLLQKALKRFPAEPIVFDELLKVDLAAANFDGVAEALHLDEAAFHTNLTQVVSRSKDYEAFRKSFAWKKWQHDWHGADPKGLTAVSHEPVLDEKMKR